MSSVDYLFIILAYIIAAVIKGTTGIGFSTSCLPIMALRLDLTVAIPLVIIPSITSNIIVMVQTGYFREALNRFWSLYLTSIPGIITGLTILISINVNVAKIVLSLVLVVYALTALSNKPLIRSPRWERNLKMVTGFSTGFINGLTGSQVMPLLPYLLALDLEKNIFVQAMNISFTLSSLIMFFQMSRLGYVSTNTLITAAICLIPVFLTVYACGKIRDRINSSLYRKIVLLFLLVMGIILLLKATL